MGENITATYLEQFRSAAAAHPGVLPVTGAQRRFLTMRRLARDVPPLLVPLYFRFPRGAVDPDLLRSAAARLAARHPVLRTRFDTAADLPVQRLAEPRGAVHRVTARPGESTDGALRRALRTWSPDGPPLRLFLAASEAEPEVETLAVVVDHAACDEQSLGLITEGLGRAYRERADPREVLAATGASDAEAYRDAVERQLAVERAASRPGSLAHWAGRLAELVPTGVAARRAAAGPGRADAVAGLLRYRRPAPAEEAGIALFPAVLGATAAAVTAVAGVTAGAPGGATPTVGYPWGGRPPGAAPVLGCFLNTVLCVAPCGADPDDLTDRWWDDLDHADTPLDEVLRLARLRGPARHALFDALVAQEDATRRPPLELGGVEGLETHREALALQTPLAVAVTRGATDLLVRLGWQPGLVDRAAAHSGFDALRRTLAAHLDRSPDPCAPAP
ncbi:condensation domain-containing protein [Kitasatospora sp. NPDC092039]|uniref:condensation domain-containing protein n=1 Tax=Kitasatospora sp. NPDC092039 TaxID=3364086 RepID=UPI003825A6C5